MLTKTKVSAYRSKQHSFNTGANRTVRTLMVAAAFMACSGSQAQDTSSNPLGGLFKVLKDGVGAAAAAAAGAASAAGTLQSAGTEAEQRAKAAKRAAAAASISPQLRALFAKGTVTGEDLYGTLTEMRQEMLAKRSVKAYADLTLSLKSVTSEAAFSGNLDISKVLETVAIPAFITLVKSYATTTALQALDEHLQYLLEDRRAALGSEQITITLPEGADQAQAKRIVTMATMVVAARVTNKILDKAEQDFKSLQTDYGTLLKQREAAAEILIRVIDARRTAMRGTDAGKRTEIEGELLQSLSEKDLAYIDTALNTMEFKDFVKDMAAQNLAINFMRSKDPEKYKDYRVKADDVVRRTQGYVRTMSGILAFGSLTANFAQSVAEIGAQKQLDNLLSSLPLIGDFVMAAGPLAKKSAALALTGVTLPLTTDGDFLGGLFSQSKAFIVTNGDKSETVGSVAKVFEIINAGPEGELFAGALFLNNRAGWLRRVYECDRGESGLMLDAAVTKDASARLAADHLGYDGDRARDFAFVNAFQLQAKTRNERELANNLLGTDQRRQGTESIGDVQKAVVANYGKWSNDQFLRLIFHNLESGAAYATLQLGGTTIKPVPSPAAVYAYESRVESCRRTGDRDLNGGGGAKVPQGKPAAKKSGDKT